MESHSEMGGSNLVGSWSLTEDYSSAEAAIALRQRLNETVEQLDELRKAHAELQVRLEQQTKEFTIVKSDREPTSFPTFPHRAQ